MFSVHTKTQRKRFQIPPVWRAFLKSSVFVTDLCGGRALIVAFKFLCMVLTETGEQEQVVLSVFNVPILLFSLRLVNSYAVNNSNSINKLTVAHPTESLFVHFFQIKLEFGSVGFCREKNRTTLWKILEARPFYSYLLSDLAFGWQWGWSWHCFDTDLTT